jgi:hypothetical protein
MAKKTGGSKKKLMKGKGKYAAYRSQQREVKHRLRRILGSQGLQAAIAYGKLKGGTEFIKPLIAHLKPHTPQNRVERNTVQDLTFEVYTEKVLAHSHLAKVQFYG